MTGPEHYRAAERLLNSDFKEMTAREQQTVLARAQVHAQLAHVAALAGSFTYEQGSFRWREVLAP